MERPCLAEPDYRFTLANERTFLAWQRTALGLLAAAIAVVQFMPPLAVPGLRHIVGAAIGLLAMATSVTGWSRWRQVDHAMRRGGPLPRPVGAGVLAAGLLSLGGLLVSLALVATAVD